MGARVGRVRRRHEPFRRVHRPRGAGDHRRRVRSRGRLALRALPARRHDHVAFPRPHLRADGGDDRVGTLGGHDRVHVHGARAAPRAPARDVRRNARPRARLQRDHARGRRALRSGRPVARERAVGARPSRHRSGRVHRPRDRVGGTAAALDREGSADGLHRAGRGAARLGRLLPGLGAARMDAGARGRLAGDVRDPGDARRAARRRRRRRGVAEPVAGAPPRRGLHPARAACVPVGRGVREAHRSAEAERMMSRELTATDLQFVPATPDDGAFAADVETAVRPRSPRDPLVYRYWWAQPDEFTEYARYVVRRDGRPIGFATVEHARWDVNAEHYASVGGEVLPEHRAHAFSAVLEAMEQRALAAGARVLRTWANEDDPERIAMVLARGYTEDRRGRRWELDLVASRERILAMTEESRARMRAEGVRLLTLANDDDPAVLEKVWRLSEEATSDVPT